MAIIFRVLILGLFALCTPLVWACAICAPDDTQGTVASRLRVADRIVLAQLQPDGKLAQPKFTVRGALPAEALPIAGWVSTEPTSHRQGQGNLVVLLMNAGSPDWLALGFVPASRADWLITVAAMPRLDPGVTASKDRTLFFLRDLEDATPLVAQAAFEEVAVRPYAGLRAVRAELNRQRIVQWLQAPAASVNPERRSRFALYYLLLGLSGNANDASAIESTISQPDAARNGKEHSAMLAALLDLRGDAGLAWVEQRYLSNPDVADDDMQAALLALSVQGGDGARVSQAQVVAMYARFIRSNPQRAGFVASDLAAWGRWEFAEALAQALRSQRQQVFASRYAIVFYLLRNPRPEVKALVEALRAEKLL